MPENKNPVAPNTTVPRAAYDRLAAENGKLTGELNLLRTVVMQMQQTIGEMRETCNEVEALRNDVKRYKEQIAYFESKNPRKKPGPKPGSKRTRTKKIDK